VVAGLQATGNWVVKAGQSKYCECMSFLFEFGPPLKHPPYSQNGSSVGSQQYWVGVIKCTATMRFSNYRYSNLERVVINPANYLQLKKFRCIFVLDCGSCTSFD
jgi:hypothetical protein